MKWMEGKNHHATWQKKNDKKLLKVREHGTITLDQWENEILLKTL